MTTTNRSETHRKRPPIIQQPTLQQARKRYAYSLVTMFAWGVWVYVWLPLVSLAAWLLGFRQTWVHVFLSDNPSLETLLSYLGVTLLLGGGLILWGRYNLHRFRGIDRRKATERAGTGEFTVRFDLPAEGVYGLRRSQRVAVRVAPDGTATELHLRKSMDDSEETVMAVSRAA